MIRFDSAGLHVVPKKRSLVIPVSARRACGIRPRDTLLLVAAPQFQVLLVHPPSVLDRMMTLYHSRERGQ
ncbi:hypothetical protein [Alloactinosynnema sp. L-07]|nr:hypothetical protein [Alloactinosynnema sp. L-07]